MTSHYSSLWSEVWLRHGTGEDEWTATAPGLDPHYFSHQGPKWSRNSALRAAAARRLGSIEVDVLVALGLGLNVRQLISMYKSQFPVL
ncbi:hypothetical protein RZS08_03340, partial [Arthrospira platensis SPKY1]|nr:hypothetical protein [Arthrospira platensis SPKY1]